MDQLNHLPRKPLVAMPKLLLRFLILLEIIDCGLSAVLFYLGLYPSFAMQPSSWDLHSYPASSLLPHHLLLLPSLR
ncbi:E3 ubiquitin-protein ligase RHA1B-like [Iris pallida]|uniref:E3 ubiquitin-protein ligase RHA1B-like n=1 Tax=Iris pallida TaxID=29817 RepID=A0AAX6ENC5_IRIPA|nr:E3 ubiquitin-protein ligase RHA1B-like [Iris pallida]